MAEYQPTITEIPFGFLGRIYRSVMPFSSYDLRGETWQKYRGAEVDEVVILTEAHEYLVHTGVDLPAFYLRNGLEVIHFPIKDYDVPGDKLALREIIQEVIQRSNSGLNFAIHCMAGYGRTGIFLACLAKTQFLWTGRESIQWVRNYVPGAIEVEKQENFVLIF